MLRSMVFRVLDSLCLSHNGSVERELEYGEKSWMDTDENMFISLYVPRRPCTTDVFASDYA